MTAQRDGDAIIRAWLDAAPRELPDAVRYSISSNLRSVPQRAPRKILPSTLIGLGVAAALVAVAVFATLPRQEEPGVVGQESPRVVASRSASFGAEVSPITPSEPLAISYGILEGVSLSVDDTRAGGPDDRTPRAIIGFTAGGTGAYGFGPLGESFDPEDFQVGSRGVVIADVTETKLHGMEGLPLGSDPRSFFNVMNDSQWWDVDDIAETTVDGRPALSGRLVQVEEWFTHLDTVDANGTLIELMHPSHLIVTEVADRMVLIQIWAGTDAELDAWMPTAMAFVDSLAFR